MAESLRLIVWMPGETVLDVESATWVHVELANGKGVTFYPGHAPLLAETAADQVRYESASAQHRVDLPSGVLSVRNDVVTLFLAQTTDTMTEVEGEPSKRRIFERLAQTLLADLPPAHR
ncbi:MAG: hypothetical protein JW934_13365 [Anaerolineae bacterium]|nr:hypothetical protein [Anaerolineae bacterium]